MAEKQILSSLTPEELTELFRKSVHEEVRRVLANHGNTRDRLLKASEAAKLLRVSKVTLYTWANNGVFPMYKIESCTYFKESELLAALKKKETI